VLTHTTPAPLTTIESHVVRRTSTSARVALCGELDLVTLPAVRDQILGLIADGCRSLVIDLTEVRFCDSSGLGVFVGAHRRLRAVDGDLELVGTRPNLQRLFEVSGLDQVLRVS
jgi:anti-sigma B factor antagonist